MQRFRPRRLDVVPPVLLAVVGVAESVAAGYEPLAVGLAAIVLAAAVLVFARAIPLAVPVLVAGIYAVAALVGFDVSRPASWIPLIAFAFFACGYYARPSRWPIGLASVLGALTIGYAALAYLTDFEPSVLFGLISSVGPWALGLALRSALDRERRVGAEVERARGEAALARERAVTSERERIAVELHDVLAHALGAMVVQASAARDLVRRDARQAARALEDVAQAGREALAETGRLLRLLRDDEDELGLRTDGDAAGDGAADRAPRTVGLRDLLLPGVFGVVATAEIVVHGYGPLWASLGVYWLAVALLAARRAVPLVMPIGVIGLLAGASALGVETDEPASTLLVGGLAYFSAGRHVARGQRLWSLAAVLASLVVLLLEWAARDEFAADVVLIVPFALGPWAAGLALRATLERTRALAAEAEHARLEHEAELERAAAAERRRIARDLHDLLARSLSVMVVQASLAADLAAADARGAESAVAEVERSGRAALGETGRLLRLIREGGEQMTTHPRHGVADLPALAAEYARAGLAVELEGANVDGFPAGIDVSIYRIVQEALTNALKHAPGSRVRVRLSRTPSDVAVEVVNGRPRAERRVPVRSGHGLTGLCERVAVYGGELDARPTADGGFLLSARMPLTETP